MTKLVKAAGAGAFEVITAAKSIKNGLLEVMEAVEVLAENSGRTVAEEFRDSKITIILGQKQEGAE